MKMFAILISMFVLPVIVHAEERNRMFPFPQSFVLEAPSISSCTSADTSAGASLVISSNPVVVTSLEVVTPQTNAVVSLFEVDGTASTTTFTRQYGPIDASSWKEFSKSIPIPSTLTISNSAAGGTVATVCIDYIPWHNKR